MAVIGNARTDPLLWCNSVRLALSNDPGRQFLEDQIQTHGFLFIDEYLSSVLVPPEDPLVELLKTPGRRKDKSRNRVAPGTASKLRNGIAFTPHYNDDAKENAAPINAFQQALLNAKQSKDATHNALKPAGPELAIDADLREAFSPRQAYGAPALPVHELGALVPSTSESQQGAAAPLIEPKSEAVNRGPTPAVTHNAPDRVTDNHPQTTPVLTPEAYGSANVQLPASGATRSHLRGLDPADGKSSGPPAMEQAAEVPPSASNASSAPAPATEAPVPPPERHGTPTGVARAPSPVVPAVSRAPGLVRQTSMLHFPTLGNLPPLHSKKSLGAGLSHPTTTPGPTGVQGPGGKRTSWLKRAREIKAIDPTGAASNKRTSGTSAFAPAAKRKSNDMSAPAASSNATSEQAEAQRRRSKFAKLILDGDVADARVDADKQKATDMTSGSDAAVPSRSTTSTTIGSAAERRQERTQDITVQTKDHEEVEVTRRLDDDYMTNDFTMATKLDDGYLAHQDYTTTNFGDYTTRTELQDFTTSNFTMQTREQRDDVLDTFKQTIARLKSTGSGKSLGGAALAEAKKAAEARVAERRREEHEPVDRSMVDDSPDKASSTVHHRTLDTEKVNMQKSSKRLSLSDLTGPPKTGEHRVQPSTTEIQTISGTSDQRTEVARPLIANVTATPNSPRSGKRVPSLNLPSGPVFSKPPLSPSRPLGVKEFTFNSVASAVFSIPTAPAASSFGEARRPTTSSARSTVDSVFSQPHEVFDDDAAKSNWMASTQETEYSQQPTESHPSGLEEDTADVGDADDSWHDEGEYAGRWPPPGFEKSTTSTWSTTRTASQKGGDTGPLSTGGRQAPGSRIGASGDDMVPSGADVPGESTEVRDIAMEGTPKDNADDAIEAASDESHEMLQYGKSTVTLVQSKKDEADEPPPLSEAQSGGFFGQASKFMGTVFGVNKKVKTEPVKSLQLAAAAAKKEQEEKEKKASRLKEMEHRRALATQRKAEEEKAHAVEEDKKMKEEAERRKREREEQTEKRPLKFAPKKDDDNTKKRKIAVDEKKPEAKKIPPKDATRATKPTVKPPVQNKPSTSFRPTTAAASSSQSVAGTAGSNGTAKTTAAPPPSSKPAKALPPSGLAANATKGKAKMKAPEEDLRQPSEVVQTQMVARIEAQLKAQQPKIASESIELPDINSEYSDSDDEDRKRTFDPPEWAQSPDLRAQLQQQSTINPDEIFGSVQPLVMEKIFAKRHSKFRARTSSANWTGTDELTKHEEKEYAKRMGFRS